jgi:drug/metabolite transporter (DMT)-like permease
VTPFEAALFVALAIAWIVGRIVLRRWVTQRLRVGLITPLQAVLMLAASFAVLPLVALPWRHAPLEILALLVIGAAMFLVSALFGYLALTRAEKR